MTASSDIDSIAGEIELYMRDCPSAGKSLEGITRWWLLRHIDRQLAVIEPAIDLLVGRGVLSSFQNRSGRTLYRLRPENPPTRGR